MTVYVFYKFSDDEPGLYVPDAPAAATDNAVIITR